MINGEVYEMVRSGVVISEQSQFADKYPWEMLKGSDWEALFAKLPRLAVRRR